MARKILRRYPYLTGYRIPLGTIESIDIEPVAACNLRCPFCQVPGWERAAKTRPMGLDLFRAILDQLPNLKHLKIQGMGEPFIHRKLLEMVKIAGKRGIRTEVITNGTLLSDSLNQDILDADLTYLRFSFDGATKSTYERLRVNADFDKVVGNIESICRLKKEEHSAIDISFMCLVSDEQVLEELPLLVELAARIGVDTLFVKERLKNWTQDEKTRRYHFSRTLLKEFKDSEQYLDQAAHSAKEHGIQFSIMRDSVFTKASPCDWPRTSFYVSVEGKIVPCCALGIPETWNMGDLTREKLRDIWNNRAYRHFRKQLHQNRIPDTCKCCYGLLDSVNRKQGIVASP